MAQFGLSPDVDYKEYDLTEIISSVATSIGAYAGAFEWGPANKIVTLSSIDKLVKAFGKPNDINAADWFSAYNFLSYASNLKTVRVVSAAAKNAVAADVAAQVLNDTDFDAKVGTLAANKVLAKYPGEIGNSLKVSFCDKGGFSAWAYRGEFSSAKSPVVTNKVYTIAAGTTASVTIGSPILTDVTNTDTVRVGMVITGAGIPEGATVLEITNDTTLTLSEEATAGGTNIAISGTLTVVVSTFSGEPNTSRSVELAGGEYDEVHVVIVDEDGLFSGTKGTVLEKYSKLSKATDGKKSDGSANYYIDVINRSSNYIWISDDIDAAWDGTSTTKFTPSAGAFTYSLTGGVTSNDTITSGERILGFGLFADKDLVEVSLVIGGVVDEAIADYLTDVLTANRKDCVGFISPPMAAVVGNSGNEIRDIIGFRNLLNNSNYMVMDTGWKYQYDPYNDKYRWVPLNADIAGLCAHTDQVRATWYSPAGFNRGYIKNVVKLAFNPINKDDRDMIYPIGINPVVTFANTGTVLYGDRTMTDKASAFQYINVRRLFIMIEKAIVRYARYVLFEFNDDQTRSAFVNTTTPYLRDIQGKRGIVEFSVVANETVNTDQVIDEAGFVANVLVKPSRSINFIQLNFAALKSGASFEEVEL